MLINAIYSINTNEILYSRATHNFAQSEDGRCAIDGGFEYCSITGDPTSFVALKLDGDYLLRFILGSDYRYGNSKAHEYPNGYHGRFKISKHSNLDFYEKLIYNYDEIREYLEKVVEK